MKKIVTILWIGLIAAMSYATYALEAPEIQPQQTATPTWIEVGTVIGQVRQTSDNKGYTYNGSNELKLYVMYIGDKLIYRVQWKGSFYPVTQRTSSYGENAFAEIPDFLYIRAYNADGSEYIKTISAIVLFKVPTW